LGTVLGFLEKVVEGRFRTVLLSISCTRRIADKTVFTVDAWVVVDYHGGLLDLG
jgi:hypothetical protein